MSPSLTAPQITALRQIAGIEPPTKRRPRPQTLNVLSAKGLRNPDGSVTGLGRVAAALMGGWIPNERSAGAHHLPCQTGPVLSGSRSMTACPPMRQLRSSRRFVPPPGWRSRQSRCGKSAGAVIAPAYGGVEPLGHELRRSTCGSRRCPPR